jgi:small-conductance mechanosensitive channel
MASLDTIKQILSVSFAGNTLFDYTFAAVVFIISLFILKIFKFVIVNKLKKLAKKTKTEIDDLIIHIIDKVHWPFYILLSLYIAIQTIIIPAYAVKAIGYIFIILITYYFVKGINSIIDYSAEKIIQKAEKEEKGADTSFVGVLSRIFKIVVWIFAVVLILANMGYNISTILAGLGIGGVAIALALQSILGDVFAAFSLYFDKPFQKGDFIIIDDDMGVVKHIGIKSTRIETLQGQELIISNKELTDRRINNYKKMEKRRVAFSFGVVYQTPTAKLKKIPDTVKSIINHIKGVEANRVHFNQFADSSLNFEVVYYIDSNEYGVYMDVQQEINLKIKEAFEKEKIEFAYPTQTIFVEK